MSFSLLANTTAEVITDVNISDCAVAPMVIFIAVIIAVIVLVILEPQIRIPFTKQTIVLDQAQPPVIGILILWAAQQTNWDTIAQGITGDGKIEPYSILILFNTLAYVCISVDQTGFFAYLAIAISKKAGTSGHRLFFYFFLFAVGMTIVTSNDTVILTLTPIIYYTAVCTNQPPLVFLLSMYYTANIFSMTLFIGSPTNIIISQAQSLTFFGYLKYMALPSVVAGGTAYICSYYYFYKDITPTFTPMDISPSVALIDPPAAVFGVINLVLVLVFLAIYDQLSPIKLWHIGAIFAFIHLLGNIYFYVIRGHEAPMKLDELALSSPDPDAEAASGAAATAPPPAKAAQIDGDNGIATSKSQAPMIALDDLSQTTQHHSGPQKFEFKRQLSASGFVVAESDKHATERAIAKLKSVLNKKLTIWSAIAAMPWKIFPFAGGMFILVNILRHGRWLDLLAQGMRNGDDLPKSVWMWGGISSIMCNFINDQPTTILMSYVLLNDRYKNEVPPGSNEFGAAMWALSVGTNLGVCFTLIGALAGIMFAKILGRKGLKVTYLEYARHSLFIILPSLILTLFAVWVELL